MKKIQLAKPAFKEVQKTNEIHPGSGSSDRRHIVTVLHRKYDCHFVPTHDGLYVGRCASFPSLRATGDTLAQAKENLAEEIVTWIETIENDAEQMRSSWLADAIDRGGNDHDPRSDR